MSNTLVWIISIALIYFLAASIGSFMLVTVMRGYRKESWVKGRSVCENCGKELKWWELIPTFSFLMLGGKCSKCKTKIDPAHFISETGFGILITTLAIRAILTNTLTIPFLVSLIGWLIFWKNVMSDLMYYSVYSVEVFIAAIIVSIVNQCWIPVIVLIALDIFLFSSDDFSCFGAGDIDVAILAYAILGRGLSMLNVAVFASATAIMTYFLVIRKREDKRIPFVPFLFIGTVITYFGLTLI